MVSGSNCNPGIWCCKSHSRESSTLHLGGNEGPMGLHGQGEVVALGYLFASLRYSYSQGLCLDDAMSDGRTW